MCRAGPLLCRVSLAAWPLNCQTVGVCFPAGVAFELPTVAGWPLNCHFLCSLRPSPLSWSSLSSSSFANLKVFQCDGATGCKEGRGRGLTHQRLTPADRAKVCLERPGTVVVLRPNGGLPPSMFLPTVPGRSGQACNEALAEEVPNVSRFAMQIMAGTFSPCTPRKGLAGDLGWAPGMGGPPAGPLLRRAAAGSWGYPPAL